MNILVTGAGGQLGHALKQISGAYDHKCFFTDIHGVGGLPLDVTDAEAVRKAVREMSVDVLINCAGYTDVDGAEADAENAALLNAEVPRILAAAAKEADAVLIHVSTGYVFDGQANTPYDEASMPNPLGVYARTKLEGERAVMDSGCRCLIFRTSWLYSCCGDNFFRTIEQKAADSPALDMAIDLVGTPTYAPDLANAIFWIIDEGKTGMTGLYNFSDEGLCSLYDFAVAVNRGLGYTCDIRPCRTSEHPSSARRPAYSVLDKALFRKTFGYGLPHWEDSLTMCLAEFCR